MIRVAPALVCLVFASTARASPAVEWRPWTREAFDQARREQKLILVEGAAAWCHWCHVMDETTYRDPEVSRVLRERFIAIRFDVDARPDLADRYAAWGWPATVLLSPDARELGKYRGYLPPEQLRALLGATAPDGGNEEPPSPFDAVGAPLGALGWVAAQAVHQLDGFYDDEQGGWGLRRKAPLSANAEFELRRAAHGDPAALRRASFSLAQQRALIDPVWGGLSQYSAATDWKSPHFEKLITYQAPAIEALARAWGATGDEAFLHDARQVASYLRTFLGSPEGLFHATQDADLNTHGSAGRVMEGRLYYAQGDPARRAAGLPWVDPHLYARDNGLAVSALCTLASASHDEALLRAARVAADRLLETHVAADGSVRHEAHATGPLLLADSAALGRALVVLAEATRDPRYRAAALLIGAATLRAFADPAGGALFGSTADPDAVGVFALRQRPFEQNVAAARFLAGLTRLTGDPRWQTAAQKTLAAAATPGAVAAQGPWLGEFLLALDDAGAVVWPAR